MHSQPVWSGGSAGSIAELGLIAANFLVIQRRREHVRAAHGINVKDCGWNMLLDLFVSQSRWQVANVGSLCLSSGYPLTTAFRHLVELEQNGFLRRSHGDGDRRFVHVALSEKGLAFVSAIISGRSVTLSLAASEGEDTREAVKGRTLLEQSNANLE